MAPLLYGRLTLSALDDSETMSFRKGGMLAEVGPCPANAEGPLQRVLLVSVTRKIKPGETCCSELVLPQACAKTCAYVLGSIDVKQELPRVRF